MTLPSAFSLEASVLELERTRIYGRIWQLVAHWDDLSRPGDFVPVKLARPYRRTSSSWDGITASQPSSSSIRSARRRAEAGSPCTR